MKIKSVLLKNIRLFETEKFEFSEQTNLIIGNNATGKTTIIEAIYYCCFLNSFRAKKSQELINFQQNNASIEIEYIQNKDLENSENESQKMVINFYQSKKKVFVNDKEVDKYTDILGKLNIIVISPSNIELIESSPRIRRKYLDQLISQIDLEYFRKLVKFKKLIKIKNSYLKNNKNTQIDDDYYELLTDEMNELNKIIVEKRTKYLEYLVIEMNKIIEYTTQENEKVEIIYLQNNKNLNAEDIKNQELQYFQTVVGNHLDDYEFLLNDKKVRAYASQGQKRLITIAFFISQNAIIKNLIKENPIIIFDDVHLDLDQYRQERITEYLKNENQLIYVTTNLQKMQFLKKENINIIELEEN